MILFNIAIVKSVLYTILVLNGRAIDSKFKMKILNLLDMIILLEHGILF